ncbi:uncharacterized protein LOC144133396 isoform X2 [Amblyomma americanum]
MRRGNEKHAPYGSENFYLMTLLSTKSKVFVVAGQPLLPVMKSELPVVARATVTSGYEKRAPCGGPGNCYFRL